MRYIGSKLAMLGHIDDMLRSHMDGGERSLFDVFGGTNAVGLHFKPDFAIISNDMLRFSFLHARSVIESNANPDFRGLERHGIGNAIDYLNDSDNARAFSGDDYYERAYSPTGGAMYLTCDNAHRIDFIRSTIEQWLDAGWIDDLEHDYLVSCLVQAIPSVSNMTGTYGAYLKRWDNRASKRLTLVPPVIEDNGRRNRAYNRDANELVGEIDADIVYVDTPYNSRQYAPNYHVLENVARNDKPELHGVTRVFDWSDLKSDYASKRAAHAAMANLLGNIHGRHLIVSYNTEGILSIDELTDMLERRAVDHEVDIRRYPYRKYKSKVPASTDDLSEVLMYIRADRRRAPALRNDKRSRASDSAIHSGVGASESYPSRQLIKSPMNYIGGKYRILDDILPLFPDHIRTFVDLFSGGANVGINVRAEHHIFNDMNSRLNEMFRFFQSQNANELVAKVRGRIVEFDLSKTNEQAYLRFREQYNRNPNPLDLYVLASYSYNYQLRFNNALQFNNPFGRNRSHFSERMEHNLRQFVNRLNDIDAVFQDGLFTDFDFTQLDTRDFVYMDPPYLITTGNYNDGKRGFLNWGERQELELYRIMRSLTAQGVRWALSNVLEHKGRSNELLAQFVSEEPVQVAHISRSYDHASYNTKGTGSDEVLITNYLPDKPGCPLVGR